MKRPHTVAFSEEPLTEYEKERAQNMMRNNRVFQSLGLLEVASILSSSSNAKSKVAAHDDSDPLYEPAADDEDDIEHGVVDKVPETHAVRPTGGIRGSKRVSAGPTQPESGERVMTRKRAREQTSEGDAVFAAPTQADEHEEEDIHEGKKYCEPNAMINQRSRGRSMGKGLERMSRGINSKILVVIVEGMRRPVAPMQAAKLASDGGIVLRQHMPIHPHWKDYKEDKSVLNDFVGKVSVKFSMDPNEKVVQIACADLLRGAIVDEPTAEGQDPKSATEAVVAVLPKSKFLQNIGLQAPAPKKSATNVVHARVQEFEAEVETERQGSAALRSQIEPEESIGSFDIKV
ncbi:unnamed protein product [Urochloa decumbens]|uniref:Uncharacterized protein n=1 Tax=Urochloa decumbens TaxID=240449 RepID=A0ABC9AX10_9POAL